VEHRRLFRSEVPEAGAAALVGQDERRPADLLPASGIDAGAERARDQLAAEADAERRQVGGEALLEEPELVEDERVARLLVRADRPAEDDEQVRAERIEGAEVVEPRVRVRDAVPSYIANGPDAILLIHREADGEDPP
jgi:hypothetical protein